MRCAFISDFIFTKFYVLCRTVHLCNINVSCFTNQTTWISGLAFSESPQTQSKSVDKREMLAPITGQVHQLCIRPYCNLALPAPAVSAYALRDKTKLLQ